MGEMLLASTLAGTLNTKLTFNDERLNKELIFKDKRSCSHKQSASMESNLLKTKSEAESEHYIENEEQLEQPAPKKQKKQLLEGCQIVLDLPLSMPIKEKQELKKKILDNGGILSYIVTRKSSIIISNGQEINSMKQKMAKEYGVPVVIQSYIDRSIMEQRLLDTKEFLVSFGLKADGFNKGKIKADSSSLPLRPKSVSIALLTAHPYDDLHGYTLVKAVLLQGRNFHKAGVNTKFHFYVLELHSASGEKDIDASKKFCVFSDEGYLDKEQNGSIVSSKKQCYYLETPDDALSVYSQLYLSKCGQPHCMIEVKEVLHPSIGTPEFQKLQLEWSTTLASVSQDVLNLVDVVWLEAIGHLNQYLAISPENIPLWKVDEAEGILLQISTILAREKWQELAERLSVEFYSILPHKSEYEKPIVTKKLLSQKQDLCQVLRDMVSVSEASGWSSDGHLHAKYRALRCHIEGLTSNTEDYEKLEQFLIQSQLHATGICIQTIYGIHRYLEAAEFSHHLSSKRLLFHATAPSNLVGILSQGLNLPKVVVQERGVERFDIGMLGGGIYFTDSLSTCIKYSRVCKERGTRFLLVSEVALGKIYETTKFETSLTAPPHGFDSVHGVKRTESAPSEFQDDEFVIYTPRQQRMHYLVEFTLPEDQMKPFRAILGENYSDNVEQNIYSLDLKDIKEKPKAKTKAKLQGRNATEIVDVPLKEVHVRAKLLDLVAQVVIFQEYKNLNESALECKYVFPLERNAAVCGFEAFINNKHVVGKIKRKEVAHKEYKEAISKGHGAYLMDEESPDVFTVSVGNIPPFAVVIIKITYILELPVNDEVITFSIPTSVAPFIEHQALDQVTQDVVDSVAVEDSCNYSVQISVEMPFPINTISSPTHEILMKQTETTAVIRANPKMDVSDGFILLISLKEIHVPRMWTEIHEENESSQASMLVFYPEFEVAQNQLSEIIIALDASNSMRGDAFQNALQTALLCLMEIPHNCYFNIVAFGTVFQELFPTSHLCDSSNIKKAKAFLKNIMPSLGNTELFYLLRSYQLTAGRLTKNVIIISDGHINNEGTVLQNAKSHCTKVRLFTCGISSTANKHMLCQLACWGGGAFEYMDPTDNSKWKSKAKTQVDRAMQSSLANVRIEWQSFTDNTGFLQAPQQITSIFNGCRQVVYGFVPNCALAKLVAEIDGEEYQTVVSNSTLNVPEGTMLHTLAARAVIRDWEDGLLAVDRVNHLAERKLKEEQIVELSKEYNLVTSITSFIAIEERDKNEDFIDDGLRLMELLTEADVDILHYMEFETLAKGDTRQYAPVVPQLRTQDETKHLGDHLYGKFFAQAACRLSAPPLKEDLIENSSADDDDSTSSTSREIEGRYPCAIQQAPKRLKPKDYLDCLVSESEEELQLSEDDGIKEIGMLFASNEPSYSYRAYASSPYSKKNQQPLQDASYSPESSPEVSYNYADKISACQESHDLKDKILKPLFYKSRFLERKVGVFQVNTAKLCSRTYQDVTNESDNDKAVEIKDDYQDFSASLKARKLVSKGRKFKLEKKLVKKYVSSVDPIESPECLQNVKNIRNYMKDTSTSELQPAPCDTASISAVSTTNSSTTYLTKSSSANQRSFGLLNQKQCLASQQFATSDSLPDTSGSKMNINILVQQQKSDQFGTSDSLQNGSTNKMPFGASAQQSKPFGTSGSLPNSSASEILFGTTQQQSVPFGISCSLSNGTANKLLFGSSQQQQSVPFGTSGSLPNTSASEIPFDTTQQQQSVPFSTSGFSSKTSTSKIFCGASAEQSGPFGTSDSLTNNSTSKMLFGFGASLQQQQSPFGISSSLPNDSTNKLFFVASAQQSKSFDTSSSLSNSSANEMHFGTSQQQSVPFGTSGSLSKGSTNKMLFSSSSHQHSVPFGTSGLLPNSSTSKMVLGSSQQQQSVPFGTSGSFPNTSVSEIPFGTTQQQQSGPFGTSGSLPNTSISGIPFDTTQQQKSGPFGTLGFLPNTLVSEMPFGITQQQQSVPFDASGFSSNTSASKISFGASAGQSVPFGTSDSLPNTSSSKMLFGFGASLKQQHLQSGISSSLPNDSTNKLPFSASAQQSKSLGTSRFLPNTSASETLFGTTQPQQSVPFGTSGFSSNTSTSKIFFGASPEQSMPFGTSGSLPNSSTKEMLFGTSQQLVPLVTPVALLSSSVSKIPFGASPQQSMPFGKSVSLPNSSASEILFGTAQQQQSVPFGTSGFLPVCSTSKMLFGSSQQQQSVPFDTSCSLPNTSANEMPFVTTQQQQSGPFSTSGFSSNISTSKISGGATAQQSKLLDTAGFLPNSSASETLFGTNQQQSVPFGTSGSLSKGSTNKMLFSSSTQHQHSVPFGTSRFLPNSSTSKMLFGSSRQQQSLPFGTSGSLPNTSVSELPFGRTQQQQSGPFGTSGSLPITSASELPFGTTQKQQSGPFSRSGFLPNSSTSKMLFGSSQQHQLGPFGISGSLPNTSANEVSFGTTQQQQPAPFSASGFSSNSSTCKISLGASAEQSVPFGTSDSSRSSSTSKMLFGVGASLQQQQSPFGISSSLPNDSTNKLSFVASAQQSKSFGTTSSLSNSSANEMHFGTSQQQSVPFGTSGSLSKSSTNKMLFSSSTQQQHSVPFGTSGFLPNSSTSKMLFGSSQQQQSGPFGIPGSLPNTSVSEIPFGTTQQQQSGPFGIPGSLTNTSVSEKPFGTTQQQQSGPFGIPGSLTNTSVSEMPFDTTQLQQSGPFGASGSLPNTSVSGIPFDTTQQQKSGPFGTSGSLPNASVSEIPFGITQQQQSVPFDASGFSSNTSASKISFGASAEQSVPFGTSDSLPNTSSSKMLFGFGASLKQQQSPFSTSSSLPKDSTNKLSFGASAQQSKSLGTSGSLPNSSASETLFGIAQQQSVPFGTSGSLSKGSTNKMLFSSSTQQQHSVPFGTSRFLPNSSTSKMLFGSSRQQQSLPFGTSGSSLNTSVSELPFGTTQQQQSGPFCTSGFLPNSSTNKMLFGSSRQQQSLPFGTSGSSLNTSVSELPFGTTQQQQSGPFGTSGFLPNSSTNKMLFDSSKQHQSGPFGISGSLPNTSVNEMPFGTTQQQQPVPFGASGFSSNSSTCKISFGASVEQSVPFGTSDSLPSSSTSKMLFGVGASLQQQQSPFGISSSLPNDSTNKLSFGAPAQQLKSFGTSGSVPNCSASQTLFGTSGFSSNTSTGKIFFGASPEQSMPFGTSGSLPNSSTKEMIFGSSQQLVPFGTPGCLSTSSVSKIPFAASPQQSLPFGKSVTLPNTSASEILLGTTQQQQSVPFGTSGFLPNISTSKMLFGSPQQQQSVPFGASGFSSNTSTGKISFGASVEQSVPFGKPVSLPNSSASEMLFGTTQQQQSVPFGKSGFLPNSSTSKVLFGSSQQQQSVPFGTSGFSSNTSTGKIFFGASAEQSVPFGTSDSLPNNSTSKMLFGFDASLQQQQSPFGISSSLPNDSTNKLSFVESAQQSKSFGTSSSLSNTSASEMPSGTTQQQQSVPFGTSGFLPNSSTSKMLFGSSPQQQLSVAFGTSDSLPNVSTSKISFGASAQQSTPFHTSGSLPKSSTSKMILHSSPQQQQSASFGTSGSFLPFGVASPLAFSSVSTGITDVSTQQQKSLSFGLSGSITKSFPTVPAEKLQSVLFGKSRSLPDLMSSSNTTDVFCLHRKQHFVVKEGLHTISEKFLDTTNKISCASNTLKLSDIEPIHNLTALEENKFRAQNVEHSYGMENTTSCLRDLLKCKGGLPLCNAVDRHIRIFARKINNYDVINVIDGTMKCHTTDLEACDDFDFWNSIFPNSEKIENYKTLMKKIAVDGYCEEDDCLELGIITEQFTPKLNDAGLKSLGIKAALDIKRMLAVLAVLIYLTSHLLAHVKEEISGQQAVQKLENLSQLLAFCLVENFPATTSLLAALQFIRNTEQNHSLVYKCLDCGNNWEMFINDYIQKPPAIPLTLSWAEIADNADLSMCYVVSE